MIERALLASLLVAISTTANAAPDIPYEAVKLQGLDKITARVSVLEVGLEQELLFGTLQVVAHACYETPPTEPPESVAFLEIHDTEKQEGAGQVFNGWMFASSPALSALEHPVYDIWVLDCLDPVEDQPAESSDAKG